MSEETLWSSMQGSPNEEAIRQKELARLAAKSFHEGGIASEEAAAILDDNDTERTWNPPSMMDELGYDPDETENRIMNPGTGIGAYESLLESPEKPKLPPEEAIPDLFEKMKPYRAFLTTILQACREEAETETVDAAVSPCYEYCHCVYTPIALRKMLVNAGALEYITHDDDHACSSEAQSQAAQGTNEVSTVLFEKQADSAMLDLTPIEADIALEDDGDEDIDEIDGEAFEPLETESVIPQGSIYDQEGYLVIEDEPEGSWKTTKAGADYLDGIDPERQFEQVLAQHSEIDDVFYDVIAYCQETPRNITDIVKHFEDDPRLGPDTYYASYVVDQLEAIGALEWKGAWSPTNAGSKLLAERSVV